jgi:hypothetical protein
MEWAAFEQLDGPILLHQRIDAAAALICFVVAKAAGAKRIRLRDFLPTWDRVRGEDAVVQSFAEMLKEAESQPSPPSS